MSTASVLAAVKATNKVVSLAKSFINSLKSTDSTEEPCPILTYVYGYNVSWARYRQADEERQENDRRLFYDAYVFIRMKYEYLLGKQVSKGTGDIWAKNYMNLNGSTIDETIKDFIIQLRTSVYDIVKVSPEYIELVNMGKNNYGNHGSFFYKAAHQLWTAYWFSVLLGAANSDKTNTLLKSDTLPVSVSTGQNTSIGSIDGSLVSPTGNDSIIPLGILGFSLLKKE